MSNQDDVITAFTDQEFDESADAPPEIQYTSTDGLGEYSDTLKVDEGEYSNSTSGYVNDASDDKEDNKEEKKDALKKPYGKLGMYKDALNYDFEDDDTQPNHQYDNDAVADCISGHDSPTPKPTSNNGYHNDVHCDDEDTKTPEPSKPSKSSGYQNDSDHDDDSDEKEVSLDQGSYMQQPMDDMLGLGSSPDVLRQRSVPKIKLGYTDTKANYDYSKTSDESEGGKNRDITRSKIETYVEMFSDSSDEEESGSFESLRSTYIFNINISINLFRRFCWSHSTGQIQHWSKLQRLEYRVPGDFIVARGYWTRQNREANEVD